jgi:signal transduction histidine kinase
MEMNLSVATKETSEREKTRRLNDLQEMMRNTSTEVRKTAHNSMPDVLVRYDLKKALNLYVENINDVSEVELDLQFTGDIERLDKTIELILYRIVQELIQNIIKHAHATYAAIQLTAYKGTLTIAVEDNGIGFDAVEEKGGYGLQNLKSRVQALQGDISIMSTKERGTTIHIEFDIEKMKKSS